MPYWHLECIATTYIPTGGHNWMWIYVLTHRGWVTHICVSKLNIIVSDDGLSPGRRQTIIWANTGILYILWYIIRPLGTKFGENLIIIDTFSFKKMYLKMSEKKRPFGLGLNVIMLNLHMMKDAIMDWKHWNTLLMVWIKFILHYMIQMLSLCLMKYMTLDGY